MFLNPCPECDVVDSTEDIFPCESDILECTPVLFVEGHVFRVCIL